MSPTDIFGNEVHAAARFASLLIGNDIAAGKLMEAAAETINSSMKPAERRLEFFRNMLAITNIAKGQGENEPQSDQPRSRLAAGLLALETRERAIVLFQALGILKEKDASQILDLAVEYYRDVASKSFQQLGRLIHARIMIIEDEPIIAMDLETIVRDMGFDVTGVAISRTEAVMFARDARPDLILADIQLADDSSGKDAVIEILAERRTQVIFITAFPEQLLTGDRPEPTFLITKPFQRSTVRSAIFQALLNADVADEIQPLIPHTPPRPIPTSPAEQMNDSDLLELLPRPAPIDAVVDGDMLRLRDRHTPEAPLPLGALDRLREHYLRSIASVLQHLEGANSEVALLRRLNELDTLLAEPLSEETTLAIGVSVDGLARLVPIIREQLLDLPAADLEVLALDLQAFCDQFPLYRRFRDEAQNTAPLETKDVEALKSVVSAIVAMPDDIVEPALKQNLAALPIGEVANLSELAVKRSIANVLKAIARDARRFAVDVGEDARKRAVAGIGFLIVALPTGEVLQLLGLHHPVEFAAVAGVLSTAAKALKTVENEKD